MQRQNGVAVRFDGVSKKFTLNRERARSFQELALGLLQPRRRAQEPEEFWVLRDVNFSVEPGGAIGFIGPNGAGKSTLLKLITRIIEPTEGRIEVHGRLGALLELGAGFHPELTGRENVFLNGSILGLNRAQIERRLDAIVAFAELERFIDVPVKHYSSGMYVRLGFAVAVHTDPEILLIDEVLAVGDQTFQHKCLERILEIQQQGATICFVSHDLGAVRRLCSQAIWLEDGIVRAAGDVEDTISAYLRHAAGEEENRLQAAAPPPIVESAESETAAEPEETAGRVALLSLASLDAGGRERRVFPTGAAWRARARYRADRRIAAPVFELSICRSDGLEVYRSDTRSAGLELPPLDGAGEIEYYLETLPLLEGSYIASVALHDTADACDYESRLWPVSDRATRLSSARVAGCQPALRDSIQESCTFKVRQVEWGERYGLVTLLGTWAWDGPTGGLATPRPRHTERQWGTREIEIIAVSFHDASGNERRIFEQGETWLARLHYRARQRVEQPVFGLAIHREDNLHICGPNTQFGRLEIPFVEGEGAVSYRVARLPLLEGRYLVSVSAHNRADTVMYDFHDRLYPFRVCQFQPGGASGVLSLEGRWEWRDGGHGG